MMILRLLLGMIKKVFIILLPFFLAVLVFAMYLFFVQRQKGKGALQVTAQPRSQVFMDGKLLGTTPLCRCESSDMISSGEYTVRLVPQEGSFSPFEQKIRISNGILTVVDRTFGPGATSEGSVISLDPISDEKETQLFVISFPDSVEVVLNSNIAGKTPLLLKNLPQSDHEVRLKKSGYKDKIIRIRTTQGYKLNVLAFMSVDMNLAQISPTVGPKTLGEKDEVSTRSAASLVKIIIGQTPTGFLRVRKSSSTGSEEITRVSPGETFELLDEQNGWYKIKLLDGQEGWISGTYAKKQ